MMKQRLLKTIALGLMAMVGVNAWADNTVRYSTDGGTNWTDAADLNALSSVLSSASTNIDVEVSADQTLTSRLTWSKAYTLTITPTADITIKGPKEAMWFLVNADNATLNIGSSSNSITFDGENNEHKGNNHDITRREKNAKMYLTNIKFKDFDLKSTNHLVSVAAAGDATNGVVTLEKITIENCTNPGTAYIYSERVINYILVLKGHLNIDASSTGTGIYAAIETKTSTAGRLRVNGTFSASTPISVMFHETQAPTYPQLDAVLISSSVKQDLSEEFTGKSDNIPCLDIYYNGANDMKFRQAYNLAVANVGAATLILPFEATIPVNVSVYKLGYTEGALLVNTEEVSTTLAANTPVLVIADEGSYKFVSTATSGDLATGSDPVTVGALTGVYAETTVPNTAYTLNTGTHGVGFYKSDGTKKVKANRAYMSVGDLGSGAPAYFDIDFNNGTTGIRIVSSEANTQMNDGIYNLQGVRVENPQKGIYIKNGKKYVVK